jgi:hypothetical protein
MMKHLVLFVAASIASWTVSAVDVGQHHVRRLVTSDTVESQDEQFRKIILQKLQQFDSAYTKLLEEHGKTADDDVECVPCSGSNGDYAKSDRGRMLKLFPNLASRVKTVVKNVTTVAVNAIVPDQPSADDVMASLVSNSGNQLFGGGNSTMGGLLGAISESPLLFLGGLTLALVIIIPLVILEGISQSTSTPIFCILGFATSILFGSCRRRALNENEAVRQLIDNSFFTKYFPNGQMRVVDASTNATSDLQELLQIGLSPGMIGYLNEVTVATFIHDIATHNATRPLTSTALLAITPILMLEQISDITNTPIRCIVGDCNNRQLQTTSSSSMPEDDKKCEIDYFRCQMKKTLMILG